MTKILSFPASAVVRPPKIIEGGSIVNSKKKALKLLRDYFKSPVSAHLKYSCYSGVDGQECDPTFLIYADAMSGSWSGWSKESWIGAAQHIIREYEQHLKIMGLCKR
jgi:hypothetical protein